MYAAVLHEYGAPRFDRFEEPDAAAGQLTVDVEAAAVNPVDLLIATGEFYIKPPQLPCVVGTDGVGRLADGRRVYFPSTVPPFGGAAERTLAPEDVLIDVPDGLDAAVAATLGNSGLAAWLSLQWRAELQRGETVLVLGATGAVGRIAVQAARLLGAARVIAAGRSPEGLERALELGADHALRIPPDEELSLAELREASEGRVDVIVDLLWGLPAAIALEAAAVGARLVQIGQAAGAESRLGAAILRSRAVDIRGYANYHATRELRASAYRRLAELARDGALTVDVERVPLVEVEQAWQRQRAGAGHKLVLVP
jgi:NADPH:quinone reductase-like Zn-dependent oxidoreductase